MAGKRGKKSSDATTQSVLDFIKQYKRENNGNSPSLREMGDGCFMTTSSVSYHIQKLVDAGKIKRLPHTARGIIVIDDEA